MLKPLRLLRLRPVERRFCAHSVLSMIGVRAALLIWPVQRVIRAADAIAVRWPLRGASSLGLPLAAKRVHQAAVLCNSSSTCLSEAVAARLMLARAGFASELRIGVKKTEGKFEAHAWLECPENIVIGNPAPEGKQYARLPALGRFCA